MRKRIKRRVTPRPKPMVFGDFKVTAGPELLKLMKDQEEIEAAIGKNNVYEALNPKGRMALADVEKKAIAEGYEPGAVRKAVELLRSRLETSQEGRLRTTMKV